MTVEAVLFDLDDTLYPYAEYARAGFHAAADRLVDLTGRDLREDLLALYFDADRTEGTFDALVARHDLPREVVPELVEAYHAATGPLAPYPETRDVLGALGGDFHLGLITDGRGGGAKLDRLGLRDHFDVVLVNHDLGLTKHVPEAFERALAHLSVPATRAVYVGDDPRVDFLVPNRLGMATVRLRRGRYADLEAAEAAAEPDVEISRLDELVGVVGVARSAR